MSAKPKEWNNIMFPYRQARKELFCTSVRERLNPTFSKANIISGLMIAGYNEDAATKYFNLIDEIRRGGLIERDGEDE
ncbi:MAG: hypothetical protein WAS34_18915 [Thiolinea sp.]